MQHNDIIYCRASTKQELDQILKLQKQNLPDSLSASEKQTEGFVTVVHTFEILKLMNEYCPHVNAKHNSKVVGYALCMHPKFANDIEVLKPMFGELRTVISEEIKFIIMGQICIDKKYRRKGIFKRLYNFMKHELQFAFNTIITEVDAENIRSLNAHKAVGFEVLKEYNAGHKHWVIISLNCGTY